MKALWEYFRILLRLHFRNRMALLYGYAFPLVFLLAFWVLYRHEPVPLLHHVGELLTIGVLGGACFGLPTAIVNDRERGLWRLFRTLPISTVTMVVSTVLARYILLLGAAALQLGVALAIGMTGPAHPFQLWVAFSIVSFAFIGLGLVLAAVADNVPAVQALGQCIFLPMLIIGGVAVPLAGLPAWAQLLSTFLPGRYAVEVLQAAVTDRGAADVWFNLIALAVFGFAGCFTGARFFRWDAHQYFRARSYKGGLALALLSWLTVGLLVGWRDRSAHLTAAVAPRPVVTAASPGTGPDAWQRITPADVAGLNFNLPPDEGVVAPVARKNEEPGPDVRKALVDFEGKLAVWVPAQERDDVQRVRNLLGIAALADVQQSPLERFLPGLVLHHLQGLYPRTKLIQLLAWIALHPREGAVILDGSAFGLESGPDDPLTLQQRSYFYSLKFIVVLTAKERPG